MILRITCLWVFFSISTYSLFASNNDFEGEISYKITYEDGIDKQVLEVLPKISTVLIKDHKFYSYTNGPLGNQGLIYNHKKNTSYSLLDLLTTALAIKKGKSEILKDRELYKIQNIEYTDEIKTILGYSCRKIIVSVYIAKLRQNVTLTAFYTLSLGNADWINETDPIYHQIRGTLLEYEIQTGRILMTYKATAVKHLKISENDFKIPKIYKVVSSKEAEYLLKNH